MADDFEPLLQIIHISDLHVVDPSFRGWRGLRVARRLLGSVSADLEQQLLDGTAPHDVMAPYLFSNFLNEITVRDPDWSHLTTWLLDTGDLTTFGDGPSLAKGQTHLQLFRQSGSAASIHGNHDAWPQAFPFFAAPSDIVAQPGIITSYGYTVASPSNPLKMPIPHGRGEIQLYSVDSVIFDRWFNTFAYGNVERLQLDMLATLIDSRRGKSADRNFRILAVHHPIHYPPPQPSHGMVLENNTQVAQTLDGTTPGGLHPLVHLVLSGHTHSLFPGHGQLPPSARDCDHEDLGLDQCQLVVGSLMQLDRFDKRGDWPHQCQVLRIYYSQSKPDIILLERLLAARATGQGASRGAGFGPYKFVAASGNGRVAEEITFAL